MKIRRGVYRKCVKLEADDLAQLLDKGFIRSKDERTLITIDEGAKKALIDRESDIFGKGLDSNEEYLALSGKVQRAINLVEETARDYERLAGSVPVNETVSREEMASAIEFTYKAEGLREALIHLRNALEPEKEAPDAG